MSEMTMTMTSETNVILDRHYVRKGDRW